MYTRESFERQRAEVARIEGREGWLMAGFAVVGGVGQLLLGMWAETHMERNPRLWLTGLIFLAYLAAVGWFGWRRVAGVRDASPRCPVCGVRLADMSLRVAVATGRCDKCGGQVIAPDGGAEPTAA